MDPVEKRHADDELAARFHDTRRARKKDLWLAEMFYDIGRNHGGGTFRLEIERGVQIREDIDVCRPMKTFEPVDADDINCLVPVHAKERHSTAAEIGKTARGVGLDGLCIGSGDEINHE